MLVEIEQLPKQKMLRVSHINTQGYIEVEEIHIKDYGYRDFYRIDSAHGGDPKSEYLPYHGYRDECFVVKRPAKRFDSVSLSYFMHLDVKTQKPDLYEKLYAYNKPLPVFCDIEIDLSSSDSTAFCDPKDAEFPVATIQITAPNLDTYILTKDKHRIKDKVEMAKNVRKMVNDYYKGNDNFKKVLEHYDENSTEIGTVQIILCRDECDLLEKFFKFINTDTMGSTTVFHNSKGFDLPYLTNRCKLYKRINGKGNPMMRDNKYGVNRIRKKNIMSEDYEYPKHRLHIDYMEICEEFGAELQKDRKSWSLDSVSWSINGIGKVPYEGTFNDMYNGDYTFFNFYGVVDTVALALCWHNRQYQETLFGLSYIAKTPLDKSYSTIPIAQEIVFKVLLEKGFIHCYAKEDKENKENIDETNDDEDTYSGGYVKQPTKTEVYFPTCFDYMSMYAFIFITSDMSFENVIGKLDYFVRDKDGNIKKEIKKVFDVRLQKWKYADKPTSVMIPFNERLELAKEETEKGNYVSIDGNIYSVGEENSTMKECEIRLYDYRVGYKTQRNSLRKHVAPQLKEELKRRGLA